MKVAWTRWLALVVVVLAIMACARVEGTGRRQFIITPASYENRLGATAYQDILAKERESADQRLVAIVKRVGERLAAVAPPRNFDWEFKLIESETPNAFCLPGGKVAIYTGILPFCETEAGLAAVMGHEIGHAIARHGGERMSHGIAATFGQLSLAAILEASDVEPTTEAIALGAFGLGSQLGVILPFSRHHESEADYLGLTYMAKAGYDPHEAPKFWQRFSKLSSGTPEFLSTHPSSDRRAADLKAALGEAQQLYQVAPQKFGLGDRL